ncbi:cytochrome C assembly family protein [Candidatus Mycalebacterium sp.]
MENITPQIIITALYFVSSALLVAFIAGARARTAGLTAGIAGFAVQTALVVHLFFSGAPLAGGLGKSLFLFSWFAVMAFLFLSLESKIRASALGAFVFTLAFITTTPSVLPPAGLDAPSPLVTQPVIQTHIALIFLGQAFFFVAFVAAVLYLFRERRIKRGSLSPNNDGSFLPITGLDRVQHISLIYGFPLATLGLAVGFFSASQMGADWSWGKKETLSIVTWLIYAVLINGRFAYGWKGRKSSFGAIAGFIAVIAVFFASYYIIPGSHTFG